MKSDHSIRRSSAFWRQAAVLLVLAAGAGGSAIPRAEANRNVALWDTITPLGDTPDVKNETDWKRVPSDLLGLETDPPKASSDPGYYGREYAFQGDAVVANHCLTAVFRSASGRVVIYSKAEAALSKGAWSQSTSPGKEVVEFAPLQAGKQVARISRCEILRNASDEVALEASFSVAGSADVSAVFSFGKTEIAEIKPAREMQGVRLLSPIDYGVVPGFIGDDLILGPNDYPSADTLSVPSENLFVGLLKGEEQMLVMTWPKGKQRLKLRLGPAPHNGRPVESIDFDNDGQSLYLAALAAPGIWHREELKPSYLEKEVSIAWQRPFPAKWVTQLSEAGVKTTFKFRQSKGQIWRGVPGSYSYPVWFSGENAFYHLSKKVPPGGESIIYFLEGQDTPLSISTPVDILKATLGRPVSDGVLDVEGRKLRTHHRRGGVGVRRACTCGCTEAIQAVFEAGEEVEKQTYVEGAVDDMVYFVRAHMGRIDEYRHFVDDLMKFLHDKGSSAPELKPYLGSLEQIAQLIPQEYSVQLENMKSLAYADELARQTIALASRKDPHNLPAYLDLGKAWRAMGGAQDYVLAQCHVITRKLFQEAGYGCVTQPKAVELAEEIRQRCRQCLRNPDGYEIWADY